MFIYTNDRTFQDLILQFQYLIVIESFVKTKLKDLYDSKFYKKLL